MSKGLQCQPRTSQHSSEAVLQTKRQFEDYRKSSQNGSSASNGEYRPTQTNGASSNGLQHKDKSTTNNEQEQVRSPPQSPQTSSQSSPRRRRTHYTGPLSSSSGDSIVHDGHDLLFLDNPQVQSNGLSVSLAPQALALGQDISTESYPNSALDGFNPFDSHFLTMDVAAEVSNFTSFDAIDPNIFQSPLLFSESLAPEENAIVPAANTSNTNGTSRQEQQNLSLDFEGWPCFACNPTLCQKVHPKTGRTFLERLEHTLKNYDAVNSSVFLPAQHQIDGYLAVDDTINVTPFGDKARDKLMVIMQSILYKARKIHGPSARDRPESDHNSPSDSSNADSEIFSILPSTEELWCLLHAYAQGFEPYYPSLPGRTLNPTEILDSTEEKCSGLLLLLMFAQGAMATPTVEARYLTSGLTEACRLSWFSSVERDVSLSTHPTMSRSALMFMNLAAWSGVKWHMDVSVTGPETGM